MLHLENKSMRDKTRSFHKGQSNAIPDLQQIHDRKLKEHRSHCLSIVFLSTMYEKLSPHSRFRFPAGSILWMEIFTDLQFDSREINNEMLSDVLNIYV